MKWKMAAEWNNPNEESDIGLSIIPVSTQKAPFRSWAEFQTQMSPISNWHSHYINDGTVGVICGKISRNLECIDVDVKNDPRATIMNDFTKLIPAELKRRLIIQTTPNNGFHLIYRCPGIDIEKNLKLALHNNKEVIIETRGEGGYFCTSLRRNRVLQGVFDLQSLDVMIPEINPEERDILLSTARSLTRHFPAPNQSKSKNDKPFRYKEPAIEDFNNKYPITDLFLKHDWEIVNDDGEKIYLLRKGSKAPHSGYYFKDSGTFFCFSTSTDFEPEKPYNHFQVLKVLEGNNDFKTTVKLLPSYGYPLKTDVQRITTDDIAEYLNGQGVRYDSFIQDLTHNGEVIDERDYNTIFIDMNKHFDREIARSRYEDVIKSNYITTHNPIIEFIKENEHKRPVGSFEKWIDCFDLKHKQISRSVVLRFLQKWYVGMIAQALGGEYPNEFFLTFLSVEQGIGKSSFLRNSILPPDLQKYRVEHSLSFDDDFKVLMGQALLIIDDEMDGHTYEQNKTFKTVLSTKELTTRRKYDRRISTIKRRCSFAGSGNNLMVVREAINRRIIPIEVERFHFDRVNEMNLGDLFIEAYHLYDMGFKYSFQHEDIKGLEHLYMDYVQKTDVDLILDEYIIRSESSKDDYELSNLDLITVLSNHFPQFSRRINAVVVGKLMNDRGIRTVRSGVNRTTHYVISKTSRIINLINPPDHKWDRWNLL